MSQYKPLGDYIPSDTVILVSYEMLKDISDCNEQKWQFSTTSLSFDAPIQRTPTNISVTLIRPISSSYCWETVRRESMPRIAEMDVEMTT